MCEFIKPSNNGMLKFQGRKHGLDRGTDPPPPFPILAVNPIESGESRFCPFYCYLLSPEFLDLSTALHLLLELIVYPTLFGGRGGADYFQHVTKPGPTKIFDMPAPFDSNFVLQFG